MSEYIVQNLNIQHISQMADLYFLSCKKQLKPELIKWKYFDNPAGEAILKGIFLNEELIGSGAMVPEKVNVLSEKKVVYKCTDLMIHPAHQGKGLGTLITLSLKDQVQLLNPIFCYTLCSKKATSVFLKNGWLNVGELIYYFKPKILLEISNLFYNKINPTIRIYDSINGLFDNYQFRNDSTKISLEKSADFLKWRMLNPRFNYKIICHYENNMINGYLIYSLGKSGFLNIVDMESIYEDKIVFELLLKALEIEACKRDYRGIVAITFETNYFDKMLVNNNYIKNPFKIGPMHSQLDFNIFTQENRLDKSLSLSNWEIYSINYDDV
ncbi:MAG: GNAT family N-acetyltransferase [Nitrospirae bacterium]|nr:GNAT family N-acetyltransferase [Nitrospirota bacterium]